MKTITLLLLCSFITTNLLAQETEIKGARSLKTVSSLPGKSISEVRSILKKAGLKDLEHRKDEELGVDVYNFYPENTPDKEYEANYMVGCKKEKVVYVFISYDYAEDGKTFTDDIAGVRRHLEHTGFVLKEKKERDDFLFYLYQLPGKNTSATIVIQSEMASFSLVMGEPKYATMVADSEE